MRAADCDILIVPGWSGSGPDHWQTRWEDKLSTARRVEQEDWYKIHRDGWAARVAAAVEAATRPVVLVAHSCGVPAVAHAAPLLPAGTVRGAFLVAPPGERAIRAIPGADPAFTPYPRDPLPFPSLLVASRTDDYCTYDEASDFALAWGSALVDAGDAGHLNTASGHGPWPEGLMRFAGFLAKL
ncbi:alpha/beta hydrolase [Chelatococcus sp. SYSU_G07232]|uniref:Alpha/beta hydrolase n=1 Tax=Chelatococcus albus TaxID=3047466 RepID=A0ABT7AI10_9HYPH|nr:alpha/beta hydrolase [Chelatococcus sp. SYSU_G07232]MDJ1158424.1 alpha/beta hydrolase [Chelatococcus sp. SYSU_G07232]